MPPKANETTARAPEPLVDPMTAEILAASNEARTATKTLKEMNQSDPRFQEQKAKVAAAMQAFIDLATFLTTFQALKRPRRSPQSHEVQMALLPLLDLLQQYRNAEIDLLKSQCIDLMQKAAKSLVEAGTKGAGFQMGKSWLASTKDDGEGQEQGIRDRIESCANDDEPNKDAFAPYVDEEKIYRGERSDGTTFHMNHGTCKVVTDENGSSMRAQYDKKTSGSEGMMNVEEHGEAHGHSDLEDAHDYGNGDGDGKARSQRPVPSAHPDSDTGSL